MAAFASLFSRVEASSVAGLIRDSVVFTAVLSGIHLLGLTLIIGGVLVTSLRLLGVLLVDQPVEGMASAPRSGILVGLGLSGISGLLLLAPRITTAAGDRIFQTKIALIVLAVAFHFWIFEPALRRRRRVADGVAASTATLLWLAAAVAGCAFILFD